MNTNSNNSINKNAIDSQLFVNCTFDMDYLEITKNETLRKYEENVFLLGNNFSIPINKSECKSENSAEDSELSDSDSDGSDDNDIQELFHTKDQNKFNEILRNLNNNEDSGSQHENILLNQLKSSLDDFNVHETILNNNKANFVEATNKFNDIYQKLRSSKPQQNMQTYYDLIQESDDLGILSETFKQYNKFEKKANLNCELPFDPTNNIIIMPL